jgi:malate dehydrogenase (oxaloacetate-decarboxylating)
MEELMRIEYSNKVIKKLRVKISDKPGYLGELTSAIGAEGGMIGEISTIHLGKGYKIRDLDIYADDETALERMLEAIKELEDIDAIGLVDIVEEVHRKGKIEIRPTVDVESIDDLKIVYPRCGVGL